MSILLGFMEKLTRYIHLSILMIMFEVNFNFVMNFKYHWYIVYTYIILEKKQQTSQFVCMTDYMKQLNK